MSDTPRPLQELEQLRDRIRVQIHLGSMEAKKEWEKLEQRFESVRSDMLQRRDEAADAVDQAVEAVESTAQNVASELKSGYQRLASLLGGDDGDAKS